MCVLSQGEGSRIVRRQKTANQLNSNKLGITLANKETVLELKTSAL